MKECKSSCLRERFYWCFSYPPAEGVVQRKWWWIFYEVFFSWYLQYFIKTVVLLMPTFIFTRTTWWLYSDVRSSSAVVLQQQWIHFRRSTGKMVTCSGAQRVIKWKVWGMIPCSWVQVLTPCRGGTKQNSLPPTLGAPEVSCVPRLARERVSWEVALWECKIPALTASH